MCSRKNVKIWEVIKNLAKTAEALKLENYPNLFCHEQSLLQPLNWDHMVPVNVNKKP